MNAFIPGAKTRPLLPGSEAILLAECEDASVDLAAWARGHRDTLETLLRSTKAVLFRGFRIRDARRFAEVTAAVCEPMEYVYRSTPRTDLGGRIYTATEYPAHQVIPVHCENTYQADWPMRVLFMCEQPARTGGETPLADVARATAALSPIVKEVFQRKRLMYVRNYRPGLDLPWPVVFQTHDKCDVEEYCRAHGIEWEWLGEEHLRTRQVCEAMVEHPDTGQLLWINQAHLFHVSSLLPKVRRALESFCAHDELPRNALHGDGSPIDETHLEHVREVFAQYTMTFPWTQGDLLVVDNMALAHGRNSFEGQRRILVAMGDAYSTRRRRVSPDRNSLS